MASQVVYLQLVLQCLIFWILIKTRNLNAIFQNKLVILTWKIGARQSFYSHFSSGLYQFAYLWDKFTSVLGSGTELQFIQAAYLPISNFGRCLPTQCQNQHIECKYLQHFSNLDILQMLASPNLVLIIRWWGDKRVCQIDFVTDRKNRFTSIKVLLIRPTINT